MSKHPVLAPQLRLSTLAAAVLSSAFAFLFVSSFAAAQPGAIEEVVVFGRGTNLVGRADAASEGSVSGADLLIRPMLKTGELLESMPGMVAVQHSGSGKANQYFLRGFNLDHGTDYSAHLDGAPLNLRSHGHGQGYLDVNGLIPETIDSIDYRKGPYRADLGDFSMAGASFINTVERFDRSFVSGETGQHGWRRFAGGGSQDVSTGVLSLAGEYKQFDGPWGQPENLEHVAVWAKYTQQTRFGQALVSLSGYDASWNPTEQIPERVAGSPVCPDSFCTLDPSAEGHTRRWVLNSKISGSDWDAGLWYQYYDWDMSSNPTYDFQLGQADKRWILGGSASKDFIDSGAWQLSVGGEFRHDAASHVKLDHLEQGQFVASISDNAITESSLGLYTEAVWSATDRLRLIAGLRSDHYSFDVDAFNANSFAGKTNDNRVSPKLALAFAASDAVELYANWGRGFHSNDARGVVNSNDPVPGLSPGTGYELGTRAAVGDFKFTAAWWWLDQDSELIFVGDSNAVEPKGGSERDGLELTLFWSPVDWLGVDAVYTTSDARYVANPEGDFVEGALEQAAQLGLSITTGDWDISARLRYMGPYALNADNSERASSLSLLSLRTARNWQTLTLYAELINALDSDGKEIVYSYEAYVSGYDPVGLSSEDIDCSSTNCRMSRITQPRTFRVGVSYKF